MIHYNLFYFLNLKKNNQINLQSFKNESSAADDKFENIISQDLLEYKKSRQMAFSEAKEILRLSKSPPFNNESNQNDFKRNLVKKLRITSYKKETDIRTISISLASPQEILRWAERTLPNGKIIGKVTSANTLHYKTFKPQKGGLFCERIFGPLKDFQCACGKIHKSHVSEVSLPYVVSTFTDVTRKYCRNCDVEYTWSIFRRYQLGYIKLILPITHVWYLKGTTSILGNLLGLKKKVIISVAYNSETTILETSQKSTQMNFVENSPLNIFQSWKKLITSQESIPMISKVAIKKFNNAEISKSVPQRFLFWRSKVNEQESNLHYLNDMETKKQTAIPFYIIYKKKIKNKKKFLLLEASNSFDFWKIFYQKAYAKALKKTEKILSRLTSTSLEYSIKLDDNKKKDLQEKLLKKIKLLKKCINTKFIREYTTNLSKTSQYPKKDKTTPLNSFSSFLIESYPSFFLSKVDRSKLNGNGNGNVIKDMERLFEILVKTFTAILILHISSVYKSFLTASDFLGSKTGKTESKISVFQQIKTQYCLRLKYNNLTFIKLLNFEIDSKEANYNSFHSSGTDESSSEESEKAKTYFFSKCRKGVFNNFYQFSYIHRWYDAFSFQSILMFISSPAYFDDKIIPNYSYRIENNTVWAKSGYNGLGNNAATDPSFSGAGLLQKIFLQFNINEVLIQNLIDLKRLPERILEIQKKIREYKQQEQLLIESPKFLQKENKTKTENEAKLKKDVLKKKFTMLKLLKPKLIRRIKLLQLFEKKKSEPDSTILKVLPVLPADLRPIMKMGDQIAASDLNRLYQRIIYRNDRLKKFLKESVTMNSEVTRFAHRLLQEAVDNLIENGKSGVKPETDSRGRALKSLSAILKGKGGRFRQYLLGKRVDYSGRSVIVVGPKLKMHQCGIPYDMAIELFLPFLLKRILNSNLAQTVVGAKTLIRNNKALTRELLREVMRITPVLLNRAPTLHRLGIQAFQPKLVDGKAILLHPLVCPAFNADFDGDQMAVHVPITIESRAEALKLMFSRNNLLSPATGDPLVLPSQDMVLGCYYLTTEKKTRLSSTEKSETTSLTLLKQFPRHKYYYNSVADVLIKYNQNLINKHKTDNDDCQKIHSPIWLKWNNDVETGSDHEQPLEIRLNLYGFKQEIYSKIIRNYDNKNEKITQYIRTTPGKILFNLLIQKSMNNICIF
uniref:DNA-directed RNA polymerase subunit beta' n=1 Tax=Carteria sp. SAG 8-5 TaxID=1756294 RepID=A0A0S2LPU2_9CHLO|nr:beta' subunit of RNA polymerase [Carteria sp. SAG 8-5]